VREAVIVVIDSAVGLALMSLAAFLSGSLPFSVWLGKAIARKDVREFGDGNPGAMNVFRVGGVPAGVLALVLDVTKGVLPAAFAKDVLNYADWRLALIAVLPVLGHAFSPLLGFRGGKALAVTLGTWIGLTTWKIPLIAVLVVTAAQVVLRHDSRAVAVALVAMELGVLFWLQDLWLALAMLLQTAIIVWMHRADFAKPARPRRGARQVAEPPRGDRRPR